MTLISPAKWLERFEAARARALAGEVEGVHDVRTAARRLRVWLRLAGLRVLEGDLRWVCAQTSTLRDLDVFDEVLTDAGRASLRPAAMAQAYAALKSKRLDATVRALRVLSVTPARAQKELAKLERDLARARLELEDESIHAYRRKIRRVRYAREWLGLDAAELERAQEVLGAVCDVLALERFLRAGDSG